MKVLKANKPGNLSLNDIPEPSNPSAGEVIVKIFYCGLCHTDFVVLKGVHSRGKFPFVLGHEFSGIVEQCGPEVFHIKPGDRVTALAYAYCGICSACRRGMHNACINSKNIPFDIDGSFQEKIITPSIMYYKIPDSLSLEEAALTEPAANGYAVVERADIYPGENVVIIGPGPIGLLSLQFALLSQPDKIIVTGTRPERLEMASRMGATHIININKENSYNTIMEITNGHGADVVLFCGGGLEAWNMAESILTHYGRIVVEAIPEKSDVRWPVSISKFSEKSISFLGISGYNGAHFEKALNLISTGKIRVKPLITHKFTINDYKEAFKTSDRRKNGAIKVLIEINKEE